MKKEVHAKYFAKQILIDEVLLKINFYKFISFKDLKIYSPYYEKTKTDFRKVNTDFESEKNNIIITKKNNIVSNDIESNDRLVPVNDIDD
jgi:hypothetical protein